MIMCTIPYTYEIGGIIIPSIWQLICGMLNSNNGGVIYIGISSDGRIDGVSASFDQRDCFRLGMYCTYKVVK